MRTALTLTLSGLAATPLWAADVAIQVRDPADQPVPNTIAPMWRSGWSTERRHVANLAVWYDVKLRNNEGTKWLKDMRMWWRTQRPQPRHARGRAQQCDPPAGRASRRRERRKPPFADLPAGYYNLVVEAAREVGGREFVRVPFQWPPAKASRHEAAGSRELGTVSIELKP